MAAFLRVDIGSYGSGTNYPTTDYNAEFGNGLLWRECNTHGVGVPHGRVFSLVNRSSRCRGGRVAHADNGLPGGVQRDQQFGRDNYCCERHRYEWYRNQWHSC